MLLSRPPEQTEEVVVQSKVTGLDVGQLKAEIAKTSTAVASEPQWEVIFPTGRAWAQDLEHRRPTGRSGHAEDLMETRAARSLPPRTVCSRTVPIPRT